jgi:hypothetical protein
MGNAAGGMAPPEFGMIRNMEGPCRGQENAAPGREAGRHNAVQGHLPAKNEAKVQESKKKAIFSLCYPARQRILQEWLVCPESEHVAHALL